MANNYHSNWLKQHKRYARLTAPYFYAAIKAQVLFAISHLSEDNKVLPEMLPAIPTEPMQRAFIKAYEQIGTDAGKREYKALKQQEPTKADNDFIIAFLSQKWSKWMRDYALINLGDMIKNISDNTLEEVRFALALAYEQGYTFRQQIALIRHYTLGEIGKTRARVIARTESTRAAAEGKKIAANDWANEAGVKLYRRWVARIDGKERDSHREAGEEKPIPADQKFVLIDYEKPSTTIMEQPGDPTAPPHETVNCRCTVQHMSEAYAKRKFGV